MKHTVADILADKRKKWLKSKLYRRKYDKSNHSRTRRMELSVQDKWWTLHTVRERKQKKKLQNQHYTRTDKSSSI